MRILLYGLLLMLGIAPLSAQNGAFGPPSDGSQSSMQKRLGDPNVRVRVVFDLISIPRNNAFEIVRLDPESMWKQLLVMMTEGSAVSEYVIASAASDGSGSTFESSEERRYPSEFVPPDTVDGELKKLTASHILLMSIIPEAYETRGIGTALEVYTVTRENDVEISFNLGVTEVHDFWRYPLRLPQTIPAIGQPIFRSCSLHKKIVGKIGSPLFIQATDFSRNGPAGSLDRLLLAFVTAIRD